MEKVLLGLSESVTPGNGRGDPIRPIQRHPWTSVGVAAALGLLLGPWILRNGAQGVSRAAGLVLRAGALASRIRGAGL